MKNNKILEYLIYRKTGNAVSVHYDKRQGWLMKGVKNYSQRIGYNLLEAHCTILESESIKAFS